MGEFFHVMNDRLPNTKTVAYCESHDQALVGDKTLAFRLMDKEMYDFMDLKSQNIIIDRGMALHKMIRFLTITVGGEAWLNFMGNEFGHPEWIDFPRPENNLSYHYARRQWSLVDADYLRYHFLNDFDKAMLAFVKRYKLMSSQMAWLLNADEDNKTLVYERNRLVFVFNWGVKSIPDYEINVKETGDYRMIFTTDDVEFGGFGNISHDVLFPTERREDHVIMKIYNVSRTAAVYEKI